MNKREKDLWQGVNARAQDALSIRNYRIETFGQELSERGVEASQLTTAERKNREIEKAWIPGVEIFPRKIHPQRHRGSFGEFVRRDEGILSQIGFWPNQWSAARMFAQGTTAADWLRRLFIDEPDNYSLRRYDEEQWDVMFFLQGRAETILCDLRIGLARRIMRFFVDGDNHRSSNNVGIVVPPGVAHAIRAEGSEEVIMVYGTSTIFHPEFEGRIASEIETVQLPESWQQFLTDG